MVVPLRRFGWRLGRRLYCAARGEPHPNIIASNGEAYVQRCVAAAVLPNALTVCDIGANKGEWTLSLLDTLQKVRRSTERTTVHIFEPVPSTLERLCANLARHPLQRVVQTHPLALSDKAGRAQMTIMNAEGTTNSLHEGVEPPIGSVEVETVTLDELCSRLGISHLHLVKSDTEGHDLSVLRGARTMLAEERIDVFQFEYNHRWVFARTYLKDVFDMIAELPYSLARIRPRAIEVLPAWHPELDRFFEANYLLVRRPALGWFSAHQGSFDGSNTYA